MPKCLQKLNQLATAYFDSAKKWNGASILLRLAVFTGSVLAIFISIRLAWLPIAAFLLSILVELVSWRAETLAGKAGEVKRVYEYANGFGQKPSARDLSNLRAIASEKEGGESFKLLLEGNLFASNESAGARRVVENLMESSWWSSHLARKTAFYYLWLIAVLSVVSFVTLFYSVNILKGHEELKGVGEIVTSVILLIFSLGLVRTCLGLFEFSRSAEGTDRECEQVLELEELTDTKSLRLLYDYQLTRASSPLIPTWVWKRHRDRLNELWDERTNNNTHEREET